MPIFLIDLIKFIHLLLTVSILGLVIYCFILLCSNSFRKKSDARRQNIIQINKLLLIAVFFAVLTGTLLVYPKHFTFHTPWIQAAYFLVSVFVLMIVMLIFFRKKQKIQLLWGLIYFMLILLLVGIIHDAVTKTTLLSQDRSTEQSFF